MSGSNSSVARSGTEARSTLRMRPGRVAVWLAGAILLALALSWCATIVATRFAPLVVFPATVGAVLGAGLVWALRLIETAHRPSLLAGAIAAALVLVAGEHYFSYLADRNLAHDTPAGASLAAHAFPELQSRLEERDRTFPQFLRDSASRGTELWGHHLSSRGMWLLWGFDAAITIGVATAFVLVARTRPYCDACGSWFRVCRGGRIDATTAQALLSAADLHCHPTGDASYRFWSCRSGCGPTGFELSWKLSGARPCVAWLDRDACAAVSAILDAHVPPPSSQPSNLPQTRPPSR